MPYRITRLRIVGTVEPFRVVAELVARAGGASRVAAAMKGPNIQPTLHKFCSGRVASPQRRTAERIAAHFGIPVDALYSSDAALKVAHERGLNIPTETSSKRPGHAPMAALKAEEPTRDYRQRDHTLEAAISTIAQLLESARPTTRHAAGVLLSSLAESPHLAGLISRQINALMAAEKQHPRAA